MKFPPSWPGPSVARFGLLTLLLGLVVACSDDESSPIDPVPPVAPVDSVVFTVTTIDPVRGTIERWVGDADGPLPESPEATERPWIGWGRPFEIRWQVWSREGEIDGYRWRVGQAADAPWLPAVTQDDDYSTDQAVFLENSYGEEELDGLECPGGAECPTLRRWDSSNGGPYRFQLRARDETGRILEHVLEWEINYPPDTRVEPAPLPDQSTAYPWVEYWNDQDRLVRSAFAAGDTVPSGSYVTVRMAGMDRLASSVDTDSFCCDLSFDDTAPPVRFQLKATYRGEDAGGNEFVYETLYSPLGVEDTLGVVTGPLSTTLTLRTADEWGRRDPSPAQLTFHGGFPPRIRRLDPNEDDVVLLAPPGRERWPENTVDYTVETGVTRWWDLDNQRWWTVPVGNSSSYQGTVYRLDLRFEPGLDPRAAAQTMDAAGENLDGRVRAWTYRMHTEYDPENTVREQEESPALDSYAAAAAGEAWVVEDAYEIFVPDLLWDLPDVFDPAGDCGNPVFCAIGEWTRRRLGLATLEARARTTEESDLLLYPLSVRPEPEGSPRDLGSLGRYSGVGRSLFPILLGIEEDGSDQPVFWPPGGGN